MRLLVFSPFGGWLVHSQVEAFLGKALETRGAEIQVLTCDALYRPCAITRGRQDCAGCQTAAHHLFDRIFHLPTHPLGRYVRPGDRERIAAWLAGLEPAGYAQACYGELPVGAWARPATLTHFRTTTESLGDPGIRETFRDFLGDTLLTHWAVERAIAEFRPDAGILFNGRFHPHRAAFEALRRHGVDVLVHERGNIAGTFTFLDNQTVMTWRHYRTVYEDWAEVALSDDEVRRVDEIMAGRVSGRSMGYPSFYDASAAAVADAYDRLAIPRGARIVGVFTSSQDELAAWDDYEGAEDQVSMLDSLFDAYRGRDVYLVVRHHPFIAGTVSSAAETEILGRYYRQALRAPANVRVVMPTERLTSYALFPYLDYAIAPFSSIALELMAAGVPTAAMAAMPFAPVIPFPMDGLGAPALRALVARLEAGARPMPYAWFRQTHRFLHTMYPGLSYGFAGLGIQDHYRPDVRVRSTAELQPGRDPVLDRVCDHLLTRAPLYPRPTEAERARGADAETAFLEAKLRALEAARAPARAAVPAAAPPQPVAAIPPQPVVAIPAEPAVAIPAEPAVAIPAEPAVAIPAEPAVAVIHVARADAPWPAWAARTRHRTMRRLRVDPAGAPLAGLLRRALARLDTPYVLVHGDGVQHEEHTLSIATALLEAAGPELDAVAFGAWIAPGGRIRRRLVLGALAGAAPAAAVADLPVLADPLTLLSVSIWRRGALDTMLAALEDVPPKEAAERLLAALTGSPRVCVLEETAGLLDIA